jgi:hypothetical protein
MAILREFLTPSVIPQAVIAQRRGRKMTDKEFYSQGQQPQQPQVEQQAPVQQQAPSPTGAPETQAPQFMNMPVTSDYLGAQFERYKNRNAPPQLDPGARVKSPNAELVQPGTFQKYYEQMGLINQRGTEMLGAAQAAASYKRMAAMNAVGNTSVGGGGSNQVEGVMPAPGNPGQVAATVKNIAAQQFGWSGAEWDALYGLVQRESGWNPAAANPSSSARGLFQKMINMHGPIESTVEGQAAWGLNYIKQRYGTPSAALNHWLSRVPINGQDVGNWY